MKNILNNQVGKNVAPSFREQLCMRPCLLGHNHSSVFAVQHRAFPPRGQEPMLGVTGSSHPTGSVTATCMFMR